MKYVVLYSYLLMETVVSVTALCFLNQHNLLKNILKVVSDFYLVINSMNQLFSSKVPPWHPSPFGFIDVLNSRIGEKQDKNTIQ